MPSCREIDPLFAAYVDGEATADQRDLVDAHLRACPKCRHQTALQAVVRETVRTRIDRPCAPEQLRARCRAAAHAGPFGLRRPALISWSVAAAVVLIAGGVLLYVLTRWSPTVLAAQLTLDHVKCFAVHRTDQPIEPRSGEVQYARDYDRQVTLPRIEVAGLQLVNVRRCFCGDGNAAHAMYRLDGRPVSLYIIPDATRARAFAEVFGYDAIVWSRQNTTYVLLGRESRQRLEELASAMNASL
jgi:anti-sigma factor (TIGR02949 family)